MEFGMSRRIKPKEKYVRISMNEILSQFGRSAENRIVELRSEFLNLVGRKVAFQLASRVLLYASFHRQDNTSPDSRNYGHSRGALAGTRNRSTSPP